MMLRPVFAALIAAFALAAPLKAEIAIQEVTSDGGLKAWLVEDHNIPFTALEVRFLGGSSLDAPDKLGATYLMAGLIEEGAGQMDSRAFAEAREALAASLNFDAGDDTFSVSARFLTENRDKAADLLREALTNPRFDEDAIKRVREQVLTGLRSDARDPASMASKAFNQMAFGDHPYASPHEGSIESVSALTRDDLQAAHRAAIARDRIVIAAAGDITAKDLGLLIDHIFGDLPQTGAPQPTKAPWHLPAGQTVIDWPSPQSVVYFGQGGIAQSDPDFFAAFILNEVLGGGRFSARLMTEIREKRGLTYGVGAYLVGKDHAELLIGQFSASNDKVAEAIDVIRAEWEKIATQGITETELATTKTYLTGAYPLRFDGNTRIASILVSMQMSGLPADYITTRNEKVMAVTIEDVKRVAARLYKPEDLHFVVVGQPEGLTPNP